MADKPLEQRKRPDILTAAKKADREPASKKLSANTVGSRIYGPASRRPGNRTN
jgi:hypothetical protein